MPRKRPGVPAIQDALYAIFYWIGMAMAAACMVLVFAGNTDRLWRFEHAHIPLSWAAGIAAMLAFAVAEGCDSIPRIDRVPEPSPETPGREMVRQESA